MALAPRRCADATVCAALKFATVRPMTAAAKALTARRMSGALCSDDPPAAIRPLRSQTIKPPRNPVPAARPRAPATDQPSMIQRIVLLHPDLAGGTVKEV